MYATPREEGRWASLAPKRRRLLKRNTQAYVGDQNEDIHELLAGRWERKRGEKVGDVVELYEDTGGLT